MLREAGIIDNAELYALVSIIYSETAQAIGMAFGAMGYGSQGRPGYLGVCANQLVLFENDMMLGRKPKTEVFRAPFEVVEFISFKKGGFGLTRILRIKIEGKKFKITAAGKNKENLERMASLLVK